MNFVLLEIIQNLLAYETFECIELIIRNGHLVIKLNDYSEYNEDYEPIQGMTWSELNDIEEELMELFQIDLITVTMIYSRNCKIKFVKKEYSYEYEFIHILL